MAAPTTVEEFLTLVRDSRLLSEQLFERILPQLDGLGAKADTPLKVAKVLCRNQVLTPYQASCLLKGQYKGFYVGKFKILELLGRGGMGKVYLAEQITMQRLVVLKVVRNRVKQRPEAIGRFVREAQAVASLRHPNIIQAYDFDEVDGNPFIVMEYIEGLNVEQQVHAFGPICWEQACDYVLQAARGLQHAHEAGLVHRDVKPGNLIISLDGQLKLLDLGLVSCLADEDEANALTNKTDQLGTVDYVSPEQALNSHNVDIRADIYSLGAVMYYMLSGKVLFPNKTTSQKLLLHQTAEPQRIDEIVDDLPEEVVDLVHTMLAKKPGDRFQYPAEIEKAAEPLAKRLLPPYKPEAVQYRHDAMYGFLRRSPTASEISSFSSFGETSPSSSEAMAAPKRVPTAPTFKSAAPYTPAEPATTPDPTAEAVRNSVTQKVTGMSRSSDPQRTSRVLLALFSLLLIAGAAGGYWYVNRQPLEAAPETPPVADSDTEPTPQPQPEANPVANNTPTDTPPANTNADADAPRTVPVPQPEPPALSAWERHQQELNSNPSLVLHLVMSEASRERRELANSATAGLATELIATVEGKPQWQAGRHADQLALFPDSPSGTGWAIIPEEMMGGLALESHLTFGVWVKPLEEGAKSEAIFTAGLFKDASWAVIAAEYNGAPLLRLQPPFGQRANLPTDAALRPSIRAGKPLEVGVWHFVVFTQQVTDDGSLTLEAYVDGALVGSKSVNYIPDPVLGPIRIGAKHRVSKADQEATGKPVAGPYSGLIDEIVLFDRVLSESEIKALYENGKP